MAGPRLPSPGSLAGGSRGRRGRAAVDAAPPLGVELKVDVEEHHSQGGTRYWARVRWHDPVTGERTGIKRSHRSRDAAEAWLVRMKRTATTGIDPGQTLAKYVEDLGDRWARGIDRTSTYDPYSSGLRLRVLPTLGHLPVAMITAGLVDRAIDGWEGQYGRSTVKNSVSALVLVLDEAVRDGIVPRNPAKDRARRRTMGIDTGDEVGATAGPGAAGRRYAGPAGGAGRGGRWT